MVANWRGGPFVYNTFCLIQDVSKISDILNYEGGINYLRQGFIETLNQCIYERERDFHRLPVSN